MQLADELSEDGFDQTDGNEEPGQTDGGMTDLNRLAEEIRIQNAEAESFEEEDVKIFVKNTPASADANSQAADLGNTSVFELKTDFEADDIPEEDIGRTNVFEPVVPPVSYSDDYNSAPKRRKKYGFFKGLALIGGLLAVIFGLAWLLSRVALSVTGENDTVSTESYDYHTSSVVINSFEDDEPATESIVIPEFTTDKLKVGDSGDMVLAAQKTLASLGYLSADKVTGEYTRDTQKAVKQFQKANFLDATGEVNKETYDLIFDTNATAPTTKTTDLPTTTEAKTSEVQTSTTASSTTTTMTTTEKKTTSSAASDETKRTEAVSSQEQGQDGQSSETDKPESTESSAQSSETGNPESVNSEKPEGISGKATRR